MVLFCVIGVAFQLTLLVNKFTNAVIDDQNLDGFHANDRSKAWYDMHPNIHVMEYSHG